jgi:hypothetical protein
MHQHPCTSITKALLLGLVTLGALAGAARTGEADGLNPSIPPALTSAVTISLSKTSLTFNAPYHGPNPPPQTIKLKNIGASGYQWKSTISPASATWLTVSPGKGHRNPGQSKTITVAVAMTTLAPGTYVATVTFAQKNDATNFVTLTVTLNVRDKAFIDVQPASGLIFNAPTGSGLQPTQILTLSNLGGQTLNNWTAQLAAGSPAWLVSVTPTSGSTLASGASIPLTVTVNATGLVQGNYTGEVDVTCATPASTNNTTLPVRITITLNVTDAPVLEVSTAELDFNAPIGSPNPPSQSVAIRNAGGSTLNCTSFSIQNGSTWLTVNPPSATGIAPGVTLNPGFQVSVNSTGLAVGSYQDFVVITANTTNGMIGGVAASPPFTVLITLTISDVPAMDVEPPTLTFNAPAGGPDPAIQTISVTNQGGGLLGWTASILGTSPWLSLSQTQDVPPPGPNPGVPAGASDVVQVIVTVTGLAAGTYSDTVLFDDGNGTTLPVFVQLNVIAGPSIQLSQTSLLFDVPVGGAPSSQTVTLTNVGSGAPDLLWSAGAVGSPAWLSVSPAGGTLTAGSSIDLTITVDPQAAPPLSAGSTVGQISVTGNAPNSPQIISVTVNANAVAKIDLSPSSVTVDVPLNGAAVQQTVTLQNVGGANLSFTTSDIGPWLDVTPASGTLTPGQSIPLTLTFTPGTNAVGTYTALVTVASTAGGPASNSPQTVFVTMNVTDVPRIDLSPSSLVFNLSVGAATATQQVTLTNVGGGPTALSYSIPVPAASWLNVSPAAPETGSVVSGGNTVLTVTATPGANVAGTYTGTVRVNSSNAQNAPQFISVTMNLTSLPRIGLNPSSLTFTTGVGVTPGNQTVTVTNTGGGSLTWSASGSVSTPAAGTWLKFVPVSPGSVLAAGAPTTFDVAIDVTGLSAGNYSGLITVTGTGATNTPQTIPVTLNILSGPALSVNPTSISFTTPVTVNPLTQTVTVTNAGGTPMDWSASAIVTTPAAGTWLKIGGSTSGVGLAAGTSAPSFTVDADVTGLAGGTYSGTVRITGGAGTANSPQDVAVTLHVLSDPQIGLSAPLIFTVTQGAGNPLPQSVTVTNLGDQTLNWSASGSVSTPAGGTWLALSPVAPSGALTAGAQSSFDVTIDVSGLAVGSYSGTVTVTASSPATNSPQLVGVTLNIIAAAAATTTSGHAPKAGYCGSVGLDVMFPLLFVWAWRRRRGLRRAAPGISALLLALTCSLATGVEARADEEKPLPRSLAQEDPPPRPTSMPAPAQEQKSGEALFDFGNGALNPHLGVLAFSENFKANGEVCGGVGLRVPSPLLSTLFGPEKDRLGFFVDATGSSVTREVVGLPTDSGTLIFATAGLYWAFLRSETNTAVVELEGAAQYGYFGGVTNLTNGVAGLVGLRGAIEVTPGLWASIEPQVTFGTGSSRLYFVNIGADIRF